MYIIGPRPPFPAEKVDLVPLVRISNFYRAVDAPVWRIEPRWPPDALREKLVSRGYRVSQFFVPPSVRRYLSGERRVQTGGSVAAVYVDRGVVYWAEGDSVGKGCPEADYVATWRQRADCGGLNVELSLLYRRPLWWEAAEVLGDSVLLGSKSPVETVRVLYVLAKKAVDFLEALASATGIGVDALLEILERNSVAAVAEAVFHWEAEKRGYVIEDSRRMFDMPYVDLARGAAPGVYRNVAEFDFKSLFPAIVVKYGIDPTSARPCAGGLDGGPFGGVCFDGGPIADTIEKWLQMRLSAASKPAADALKLLMNAAVGAWGKAGWGIICEPCLVAVRNKAAWIFDETWRRLRPIYGDTDSFYIEAGRIPDAVGWGEALGGFLLELRGVWEVFILVPARSGGVAEKNYIKAAGGRVEVKGGLLRPHDLPLAVRARYAEVALSGDPVAKAVEILKEAPPRHLFIYRAVERGRLAEIKKPCALHVAASYFAELCRDCVEVDVYFLPGDGVVYVPWLALGRGARPVGVEEVRRAAVAYVSRLWKLRALRAAARTYIYRGVG